MLRIFKLRNVLVLVGKRNHNEYKRNMHTKHPYRGQKSYIYPIQMILVLDNVVFSQILLLVQQSLELDQDHRRDRQTDLQSQSASHDVVPTKNNNFY